jgi:hypothetical protein
MNYKLLIAVVLLAALSAVSSFGQCAYPPNYGACGYIHKQHGNGTITSPTVPYNIKFCSNQDGTGSCYYTTTGYPDYSFFTTSSMGSSGRLWMFAWNDGEYWGSPSVPVGHVDLSFYGSYIEEWINPRPLPPTPVYPSEGQYNVPTSFNLQWTDGLDNDRRNANWPVTYDIYASGNEYPESLVFSNIPCNGVGTCNAYINGLVYTTRYQWRVVAKLAGWIDPAATVSRLYTTSSSTFHFSTTWDPSTPTYTIQTINGYNLLKAANGGGGSFDATGVYSGYDTQFKIQDVNGGTLYSGDQVHLQTNKNYFVSAVNGGCDTCGVNAQPKWSMGYETWTIIRIAGSGPINPGDQVAFQSYNNFYMCAEGGGGQAVNANRTAIGAWETFTFR